jgi:hypothetical protein
MFHYIRWRQQSAGQLDICVHVLVCCFEERAIEYMYSYMLMYMYTTRMYMYVVHVVHPGFLGVSRVDVMNIDGSIW